MRRMNSRQNNKNRAAVSGASSGYRGTRYPKGYERGAVSINRDQRAGRPAQQRPAQQRPAQQRPAQQRPAQQRPAQQRSAQQRSAQQRSARQAPIGNRQTQAHPQNAQNRAASYGRAADEKRLRDAKRESEIRVREAGRREAESRARLEAMREARKRAETARRRREAQAREARIRAEKRALKEKMRVRRKAERKQKRKLFFGRLLVGSVIFVLLAALSAGLFAFFFTRSPDAPKSSKVTYLFGGKSVRSASASEAFRDGVLYVCFNDVGSYLSMAVTGSADEMTFIFPKWDEKNDSTGTGDEESVTFRNADRTVNVGSHRLTVERECRLSGEKMWVPFSFVSDYMDGLNSVYNKAKNTVSISRIEDEELSSKNKPVYLPVSLKLKDQIPIGGYQPGNSVEVPEPEFINDLSEYEAYMNPPDASEYLVLVNASNTLDAAYVPDDLTDVAETRQDGREAQKMRLFAAKALEALFLEMKSMGYTDMSVMSGYRSYAEQSALFENYVANELTNNPSLSREKAEENVLTYSSRPGTSEHQTGLAVDMHNLEYADESFAETAVYGWLKENAWKFGYIVRFPEGKTDLTGVKFEPWHFRYVGRAAAYAIKEQGICLEEYAATVK